MMRKVLNRRHARIEPGFNLTPMLDMIFYLLFFFIMATKIRDEAEQRMDVKLPSAQSAATVPAAATPSLTITSDGQVFFRNRAMTRDLLDRELRALAAKGQQAIAIRGDERVDLGRAVEVLDWCRLAGLKDAMLELRPPEANRTPRP